MRNAGVIYKPYMLTIKLYIHGVLIKNRIPGRVGHVHNVNDYLKAGMYITSMIILKRLEN